jgi:hypothetical protein
MEQKVRLCLSSMETMFINKINHLFFSDSDEVSIPAFWYYIIELRVKNPCPRHSTYTLPCKCHNVYSSKIYSIFLLRRTYYLGHDQREVSSRVPERTGTEFGSAWLGVNANPVEVKVGNCLPYWLF